jgi:hypothetical protein
MGELHEPVARLQLLRASRRGHFHVSGLSRRPLDHTTLVYPRAEHIHTVVRYTHQGVLAVHSAGERNPHRLLELSVDQQHRLGMAQLLGLRLGRWFEPYCMYQTSSLHHFITTIHRVALQTLTLPQQFAIWNPSIDQNAEDADAPSYEYDCALVPSVSYCIALASPTQGKLFGPHQMRPPAPLSLLRLLTGGQQPPRLPHPPAPVLVERLKDASCGWRSATETTAAVSFPT